MLASFPASMLNQKPSDCESSIDSNYTHPALDLGNRSFCPGFWPTRGASAGPYTGSRVKISPRISMHIEGGHGSRCSPHLANAVLAKGFNSVRLPVMAN
jgi:hypothetical protein